MSPDSSSSDAANICDRFPTLQIPIGVTDYGVHISLEAVRRFNGETASVKRAQRSRRLKPQKKRRNFRNRPFEIFGALEQEFLRTPL
ncbi:hypothetical protein CDAR_384951 [Caerostris darwini]|uniref:Uncharacterized protein n=1 Tax=Caerostris darwini TaxID=1538125 RepID=A0AAV4WCH8_9ARAC|nr:hypothetical protein CDAR_384951 [Caerostris darwini]